MSGVQIMQAIIEILVGGISGVATGIGQGLSTFGVLVVVFAGISLAIGLSRWVVNFVASLGARNR